MRRRRRRETPAQASTLSWGACADEDDPDLQCATLTVPLDYAHPERGLGRSRPDPAAGAGRPAGRDPVQPGRPRWLGLRLRRQRGLGDRQRVRARAPLRPRRLRPPRRAALGRHPLRRRRRRSTPRCTSTTRPTRPRRSRPSHRRRPVRRRPARQVYGGTLRFYSTANTARDMDSIRAALGDEQISYIGICYGTYLGGVYARLFPERVRAMVLDAAFEPSGDSEFDQWATQLVGFEHAFDDWAAWCEEGNDCAFNAADVGARWDALFDSLDANPLTAADGRASQPGRARDGDDRGDVQQGRVAGARLGARRRRGGRRHRPARPRRQLQRAQPRRHLRHDPPVVPGDPLRQRARAARTPPTRPRCSPRSRRRRRDSLARMRLEDFDDDCTAIIPGHQKLVRAGVQRHGSDPRRRRASTTRPRRSAGPRSSTAEMGPSATLLTYSGEGHGAILSSTCVDEAEAAMIRDLTLPAAGHGVRSRPDVPRPAYWDQLPVPDGRRRTDRRSGARRRARAHAVAGLQRRRGRSPATPRRSPPSTSRRCRRLGMQTAEPVDNAGALVVPALSPDGSRWRGHLLRRRCWRATTPTPTFSSTCRPARASCWCSPTRPRADPRAAARPAPRGGVRAGRGIPRAPGPGGGPRVDGPGGLHRRVAGRSPGRPGSGQRRQGDRDRHRLACLRAGERRGPGRGRLHGVHHHAVDHEPQRRRVFRQGSGAGLAAHRPDRLRPVVRRPRLARHRLGPTTAVAPHAAGRARRPRLPRPARLALGEPAVVDGRARRCRPGVRLDRERAAAATARRLVAGARHAWRAARRRSRAHRGARRSAGSSGPPSPWW